MKFYKNSNFNKQTTGIDTGYARGTIEFENRELDVILDSYDELELRKALFLRSVTRGKDRMEWLDSLEDFRNPERFENAKIYYYNNNLYWEGWEQVQRWRFENELDGEYEPTLIFLTEDEDEAEMHSYGTRHEFNKFSISDKFIFAVWE